MQITDPQGQVLTPEDVALFNAHPNLLRLAVKAQRIESDPVLSMRQRQGTLLLWGCEMLDLDNLRWQALATRHRNEKAKNEKAKEEKAETAEAKGKS